MTAAEILAVPGAYEIFSDELKNQNNGPRQQKELKPLAENSVGRFASRCIQKRWDHG